MNVFRKFLICSNTFDRMLCEFSDVERVNSGICFLNKYKIQFPGFNKAQI